MSCARGRAQAWEEVLASEEEELEPRWGRRRGRTEHWGWRGRRGRRGRSSPRRERQASEAAGRIGARVRSAVVDAPSALPWTAEALGASRETGGPGTTRATEAGVGGSRWQEQYPPPPQQQAAEEAVPVHRWRLEFMAAAGAGAGRAASVVTTDLLHHRPRCPPRRPPPPRHSPAAELQRAAPVTSLCLLRLLLGPMSNSELA